MQPEISQPKTTPSEKSTSATNPLDSLACQEDIVAGAMYRHYKGNLYRVICVAKSSETLTDSVVYEALYPNPLGQIWSRLASAFTEVIEVEGMPVPRFQKVTDDVPENVTDEAAEGVTAGENGAPA